MNPTSRLTPRLLALGIVGLVACGGGDDEGGRSVRELCNDYADVVCAKLYGCLTPEELEVAGLPPTEAECVGEQRVREGCVTLTVETACDGDETYDPGAAQDCVDDTASLSCDDLAEPPASCEAICSDP